MKQPLAVLSYNLHYHKAYQEAFALTEKNNTDILCLQECDADRLQNEHGDFSLACKTEERTLGLAIYYQEKRMGFISSRSYYLKRSVYERVLKWNCERLLVAEFYDKYLKRKIVVASLHSTHLVASNRLRRKQLENVFEILGEYKNIPIVIAGDYNYPWFHGGLTATINRQGYSLYIPPNFTYMGRFKGKFDFVSAIKVSDISLKVLPQGSSDHLAIYAEVLVQ